METVLIYSGGLDSTALLYQLLHDGHTVVALSVDYGQCHHKKEFACAGGITRALGVVQRTIDLRSIAALLGRNSLTDPSLSIPEGHYTEESMKVTVVPNRNMILIAIATAWAIARKAQCVAYAAHACDHAIYPDCREAFITALGRAMGLADWHSVSLYTPFAQWTKAEIVKRAHALGVTFERTWSCYKGGSKHCGRCGTCIERREAFYLAGIDDPTEYDETAPRIDIF